MTLKAFGCKWTHIIISIEYGIIQVQGRTCSKWQFQSLENGLFENILFNRDNVEPNNNVCSCSYIKSQGTPNGFTLILHGHLKKKFISNKDRSLNSKDKRIWCANWKRHCMPWNENKNHGMLKWILLFMILIFFIKSDGFGLSFPRF